MNTLGASAHEVLGVALRFRGGGCRGSKPEVPAAGMPPTPQAQEVTQPLRQPDVQPYHFHGQTVGYHPGIKCDKSGQCPILGNRYHCEGDYINLCEAEYLKLLEDEQVGFTCIPPSVFGPVGASTPTLHPEIAYGSEITGVELDAMQSDEVAKRIFTAVDADGDGRVTLAELEPYLLSRDTWRKTADVQALFSALAADKDGGITQEELRAGLGHSAAGAPRPPVPPPSQTDTPPHTAVSARARAQARHRCCG